MWTRCSLLGVESLILVRVLLALDRRRVALVLLVLLL